MFTAYAMRAGDQINKNNNYLGISNMWIDSAEQGIRIDVASASNQVAFLLNSGGGDGTETMNWVAYAPDDPTVNATGTHSGSGTLSVTAGGLSMGRVDLFTTANTKAVQIGAITVNTFDSSIQVPLTFPVVLTDSDADQTSTTLSLTATPSLPPHRPRRRRRRCRVQSRRKRNPLRCRRRRATRANRLGG